VDVHQSKDSAATLAIQTPEARTDGPAKLGRRHCLGKAERESLPVKPADDELQKHLPSARPNHFRRRTPWADESRRSGDGRFVSRHEPKTGVPATPHLIPDDCQPRPRAY